VFQRQEGRGRGSSLHSRPDDSTGRGRGARGYRNDDEEGGPRIGPGRGGHGGPGRGRGGLGRIGWSPRALIFGPGRGRSARRGDVRAAILSLLVEEPMHGYQVIQRLDERSHGMWRPSAGSVYPTLQQLEDEGLVRGEEQEGRKVYSLTDDGRKAASEAARERAPWEMSEAPDAAGLWGEFKPLAAAVAQVSQVGSAEALEKSRVILAEARRSLYRLLAEDDQSGANAGETGPEPGAGAAE
jgi:DNA-binding PadR family transcriptional regulator